MIYVSFIEEAVMNPNYKGFIAGRIEVYISEDCGYHSEEIRFFTKNVKKFNAFRDKYDLKEVTKAKLETIRKTVQLNFMESGKGEAMRYTR